MGRDAFITISAIPVIMQCYECAISEATMKTTHEIISQPETCIERYLCLECFIHEVGQ